MHHPSSHAGARVSFQFVFLRALPVTGSTAGDAGGEGEAESDGARERQAGAGRERETAEGKGERDRVREVEPSRFYLLRAASSFPAESHQPCPDGSCWLGRDGGAHPSSRSRPSGAASRQSTLGSCLEVPQNTAKLRISFTLRQWGRKAHGPLRSAAHQHWLCLVGRGAAAHRGNPTLHLFMLI